MRFLENAYPCSPRMGPESQDLETSNCPVRQQRSRSVSAQCCTVETEETSIVRAAVQSAIVRPRGECSD